MAAVVLATAPALAAAAATAVRARALFVRAAPVAAVASARATLAGRGTPERIREPRVLVSPSTVPVALRRALMGVRTSDTSLHLSSLPPLALAAPATLAAPIALAAMPWAPIAVAVAPAVLTRLRLLATVLLASMAMPLPVAAAAMAPVATTPTMAAVWSAVLVVCWLVVG